MSESVKWLNWLECCSVYQKVGDLIPQGTYLCCGFKTLLEHVCEATNQCFSLSTPCPSFLSKKQIKKKKNRENIS